MTATAVEKNLIEKKDKRAKSIAAMGLVNREADKFLVSTPSLRGKQTSYEVWRDEAGKIRCNCLEFEEAAVSDAGFRCEHILAVKYALVAKNTESATKQPLKVETTVEIKPTAEVETEKSATESHESTGGEQRADEVRENVLENGHSEAQKVSEPSHLANIQGDDQMTLANTREAALPMHEEPAQAETANNVLNFTTTLRELRKNVDPELVKQREGWRDRNGNTHYVDYVEWHTVADILDENAPNWSHTIRDIKQIGDIFAVTVAITIDGVTREGIGTGTSETELGIKKAEHDALKRAAVKFGIARELYKKESDRIERDGAVPTPTNNAPNNNAPTNNNDGGFPANPIARSLSDLVTAKQLGMIRAIAREIGIEADAECDTVMQCKTDELSKKAASGFIQHLQDLQKSSEVAVPQPMRRAG